MRAVLDTNVLISALFFEGVPREIVGRALRGEYQPLTSVALLGELERVLVQKFNFSETRAAAVRLEVEAMSSVLEVTVIPRVLSDSGDNEVLAVAHAGSADLIVTGDRHLLDLVAYEETSVETPRAFLDRLAAGPPI